MEKNDEDEGDKALDKRSGVIPPTGQSSGADRSVVGMIKSQSCLSGRHPDTITSQLESQVGSEKGEILFISFLCCKLYLPLEFQGPTGP